MEIEVRWEDNVRFTGLSQTGHEVPMDGPDEAGGTNAGPRPMELVLLGLGGCASYDVVTILRKGRQDVVDCVAKVSAVRADEPPRVFTKVHIHFDITGRGLSEKKVARAVELSADKYCSASIMIGRSGAEVTHDYTILEAAS